MVDFVVDAGSQAWRFEDSERAAAHQIRRNHLANAVLILGFFIPVERKNGNRNSAALTTDDLDGNLGNGRSGKECNENYERGGQTVNCADHYVLLFRTKA